MTARRDAIEKLEWYAMRWKIETFHKIHKSVCRVEESKLRTADRLVNLLAIFCLLSWSLFWITMLNRAMPNAPAKLALTPTEMDWLNPHVRGKQTQPDSTQPLSPYLIDCAAWKLSRTPLRPTTGPYGPLAGAAAFNPVSKQLSLH